MPVDLPAQPLAQALAALSQQAGVEIIAPGELVAGRQAPAVRGTLTPAAALERLLAGSGLEAVPAPGGGFVVRRVAAQADEAVTLAPITVEGRVESAYGPVKGYKASRSATATRTDASILETPVSIQVLPQQVVEDQAALRLNDVYRNVSGVTPAYTGNNMAATEGPIIRGFSVFNTYWNGFRLRGQSPSVLANVQRIEVLKGPASVLYGRQEPGGLVNLVTKQPLDAPYRSIEQRVGSFDYYETLFDVGAPLNDDGSLRYRINGSYQNAGSFRDFVDNERWFIAPVLTWMITPRTELTVEGSYMHNDFLWDNGLVFSPATFDPPFEPVLPIERFLQEPAFRSTREEIFASYRLIHEITDDWKVRHMFLYHRNEFDINAYRIGAVTSPGPGQITVNRRFDGTVPTATEFNAIFDTIYKFELGSTKHELLAGVDLGYEPRNGNTQNGPRENPNRPIDAFNPVYGAVPTDFRQTSFFSERFLFGTYFQDQMSLLDDRLHLLLGGRFDYVDQESLFVDPFFTPPSGSGGKRHDSAFTFRLGALYKAASWLHPYFSYSQGFVPPATATVGPVNPEASEQFELGFKMPFFEERLVANLAVYQLTKDNVIGDANNDGINENFGELRSRGIEFDLIGEIHAGLSVILTYAYTDTEVLRSTILPVGARFIGVPLHLGSAWLKYDFAPNTPLQGLSLGTGVYLVDSRPGNNANAFEVDGYGRWDAFVRYRWRMAGPGALTAQLNVQNILDKEYYETVSNLAAVPGAPLSVMASLKLEF